jgi:hypothetical protein
MGFSPISISGKTVYIHSAISEPDFGAATVLSDNPWDYVALWLRRAGNDEARFYWEQSREFYKASIELSPISSPLTSYYCFLNATKSLLTQKKISFSDRHGVTGSTETGKKCLNNEIVKLHGSGVLSSLCRFLGEDIHPNESYSLNEIFYHLPFLHRAFTLTYKSKTELFLPVKQPMFVRKDGSDDAWFVAELDARYASSQLKKILPSEYEIDTGVKNRFLIRRKKRFKWKKRGNYQANNLINLVNYHKEVRRDITPIFAPINSWYVRKKLKTVTPVTKSQLPLIFVAMHKLSELSRYDPITLVRHLDLQHNWILTEFLQVAPAQFINQIACEITGKEFVKPYAARLL